MQLAFLLGKHTYNPSVIIRHEHPDNTKEDIDALIDGLKGI